MAETYLPEIFDRKSVKRILKPYEGRAYIPARLPATQKEIFNCITNTGSLQASIEL
jgi:hypothetical protein